MLGITAACAVQGFIRERMQAGYDPEYLRQIFDFIVYTISCMEAPARRESTQKARLLPLRHLHPHLLQSHWAEKCLRTQRAMSLWKCCTAQMLHPDQCLQLVGVPACFRVHSWTLQSLHGLMLQLTVAIGSMQMPGSSSLWPCAGQC